MNKSKPTPDGQVLIEEPILGDIRKRAYELGEASGTARAVRRGAAGIPDQWSALRGLSSRSARIPTPSVIGTLRLAPDLVSNLIASSERV